MLYTAYLAGWDAKKSSYSTGRMINQAIGEYRDSTEEVIDMWLKGWVAPLSLLVGRQANE